MAAHILDWLNLMIRWGHLIAGIAWIGSSFYFVWLDSALDKSAHEDPSVEGSLWMVHSGGFYRVEKRLIRPGQLPAVLHWFKWEATLTLVTGIFLLAVVYYANAGLYLIEPGVSPYSAEVTVGICIGAILAAWFIYDQMWKYLEKRAYAVATVLSVLMLIGSIYGFTQLLSGRAAFIHVGAMLGLIMVVNVWVRILPAQQNMINATQRGEIPDYSLGRQAKTRSMHNSYVTLPVLFIMLSNHFPATFSHKHNWLVLALFFVAGGMLRHFWITHEKKKTAYWTIAPALLSLGALIWMTAPETPTAHAATGPKVTFAEANDILVRRCRTCHSATPTDDVFKVAPNGIVFDNPSTVKALAGRIRIRACDLKTMPIANKTQITDEERNTLARWVDQGANIE